MALIGEPYLVCWTPVDNTLRLYRKAGDAFVQLDSIGEITRITGEPYPRPSFLSNGVLTYSVNFDDERFANLISTNGVNLDEVDSYEAIADSTLARFQIYPVQTRAPVDNENRTRGGYRVHKVNTSGALPDFTYIRYELNGEINSTSGYNSGLFAPSDHVELVAPNGFIAAFTLADSSGYQIRQLSETGQYGGGININMPKNASSVIKGFDWSDDSRTLLVLGAQINTLEIVDVDAANETATVEGAVVVPEDITSMARFGSFIAVGTTYDDGGSPGYRTYIYRKSGYLLVETEILEDIGNDLLWLADGSNLIDPSSKTAYAFDGSDFTENNDLMVNITAGVLTSALSQHRAITRRNSFFYDGAISYFGLDNVPTNLKVLLLGNGASFVNTHSTVNEVIGGGSFEIADFGWPLGGIDVENVAKVITNDSITWLADAARQGIIGGSLQSTGALIYDGTTPLIYVDFGEELTFNANEILSMDFTTGFAWLGFN